jgi:glyoxylase-like metal-dependent hydrolase (beta-lactamase superfamily II)/rhodanese-related sulfurtransferase
MGMYGFTALELFNSLESGKNCLIIDVRNQSDFEESHVEMPGAVEVVNIPYFDFIEDEETTVAIVPKNIDLKIICAKEASSVFVAAVLEGNGYESIGFLEGGYAMWQDLLVAKQLHSQPYQLWQFIRPAKASCSYAVAKNGEMFIFDPSRNVEFYQQFASQNGCEISHVFETHLQADYISGGPAFEAIYAVHEDDFKDSSFNYHAISDGENYDLDGVTIKVIHSPGHTPGSTCYIIDKEWMITGDTVFIVSIGRPDLGGKVVEWSRQLYATLKQRISVLPESLKVLPGHFSDWSKEVSDDGSICSTFGQIIQNNEDIYGINDVELFVEFIQSHMRAQPEIYSQIRLVNTGHLDPCPDERQSMDIGKNQCAASQQP